MIRTRYKVWVGTPRTLRGEFLTRKAADDLVNELQATGQIAWVQVVY